jgi:serine/threonine protein kinase
MTMALSWFAQFGFLKSGQNIFQKIADFGLSKDAVASLAIYQTNCGTLCYMAPYVYV